MRFGLRPVLRPGMYEYGAREPNVQNGLGVRTDAGTRFNPAR